MAGAEPAPMERVAEYEDSAAYDSGGADSVSDEGNPDVVISPEYVITEGEMVLVVDEPTETATLVTQAVREAGGYVESRSEWAPTDDSPGDARLVLRIPADKLDAVLEEIKGLGELSRLSTSETTVTLEVKDLAARMTALETSIDRLLAMLAAAERTEDLITIERTLQERQGELESMRAQREVLMARAALSTIELSLTTEPPPPTVGPGGFWPGVVAGWDSLLTALRGAAVVVGVLIPWVAFFAVVGFVLVKLVQRWRRKRKARAPRPSSFGGVPHLAPQSEPAASKADPPAEA